MPEVTPNRGPLPGPALLAGRFAVPATPRWYVSRPRLVERLTRATRHPLTVVTGVVGAGKTTLAAGWARAGPADRCPAWLTLDEDDNRPEVFWSGVVEALRRRGPASAAGPGGIDLPEPGDHIDRRFLTSLAAALHAAGAPVVLILDRFDAVADQTVGASLDLVLRHAAPTLRVLVLARHATALPIHRYRLRGDVVEITDTDLLFTQEETRSLFERHGLRLPQRECTRLQQLSEGWAGALRLLAYGMRSAPAPAGAGDGPMPGGAGTGAAPGQHAVLELLVCEALDTQPPSVRDLLLRVSVVEDIHAGLADRLADRSDSQALLASLARSNAFVRAVAGPAGPYRCHRLFRQALRVELDNRSPGLARELHGRAARWYAGRGDLVESVAHATAAGDREYAARQLVDSYRLGALLSGPDAERLRALLSGEPGEPPGCHSALVAAVLAVGHGDPDSAARWLGAAVRAARGLQQPERIAVDLGSALLEAILHRCWGRAGEAAAVAGRAEDLQPQAGSGHNPAQEELRLLIRAQVGAAQGFAGDTAQARRTLQDVATRCEPRALDAPAQDALGQLALLELAGGDLDRAVHLAEAAIAVAERLGRGSVLDTGAASVALAGAAMEWNRPAEAAAHLDGAESAAMYRDPAVVVEAAALRARLALGRAETHLAREIVDRASRTLADRGRPADPGLTAVAVRACLLDGDHATAAGLAASLPEGPDRTLLEARVHLHAGGAATARRSLGGPVPGHPVATTIGWLLLRAELSAGAGDGPEAQEAVRAALAKARSGQRRRPFVEAGPWLRRMLRQRRHLIAEHPWLVSDPDGANGAAAARRELPSPDALTGRETQVLRCAAQAMSAQDIGGELHLSINTVKTHLKSIYRKLGVEGRSQAARRARDLRLLDR